MKTKLLIALLAMITTYAVAQEKKEKPEKVNVPEVVKKGFTSRFAAASDLKWGIEKPGEYEAEFTLNKAEMSALVDEKGNILEVETEIRESELPQAVKVTLSRDFADYKIGEVEKNEQKGITSFEMEAKKGEAAYELAFDKNGKLLKKESIKEKDND